MDTPELEESWLDDIAFDFTYEPAGVIADDLFLIGSAHAESEEETIIDAVTVIPQKRRRAVLRAVCSRNYDWQHQKRAMIVRALSEWIEANAR